MNNKELEKVLAEYSRFEPENEAERLVKVLAEELTKLREIMSDYLCHKCGELAVINDGEDHKGPLVCTNCYSTGDNK